MDNLEQRALGLVPPHPERRPHYCNDMVAQVHVGGGAIMAVPDLYTETQIAWALTWGDADACRYVAASLIMNYGSLLSPDISAAEAIRRLRILRAAQVQLRNQACDHD